MFTPPYGTHTQNNNHKLGRPLCHFPVCLVIFLRLECRAPFGKFSFITLTNGHRRRDPSAGFLSPTSLHLLRYQPPHPQPPSSSPLLDRVLIGSPAPPCKHNTTSCSAIFCIKPLFGEGKGLRFEAHKQTLFSAAECWK